MSVDGAGADALKGERRVALTGKGFAIRTPDGRVLGYGLDHSTEGSELIEVGREVRLTVLAGDEISEIVARVEPAGASDPG